MLRALAVLLLSAATTAAQVTTRPPGAVGSPAFTGGTITAPILATPGECVTVPYSFTGFATSGFDHAGITNATLICIGGAEVFRFNALGPIAQLRLLVIAGTAAAPSVVFSGATTTGFYHAGPGVGFSVAGASVGTWTATALTSTVPFLAPAGSAAAPALSFSGDPDTGIFQVVVDRLAFVTGGTTKMVVFPTSSNTVQLGSGVQWAWSADINPDNAFADTGLARSAAGVVKVTNGGAGLGYSIFGQVVEVNTTTKAPAITESGELYTNTGDADGSVINLPNDPTIGTQFRAALTVAQTVTINAATGETIQDVATSGTSTSAGAIGDTIHLIAVTGGSGAVWMVVSKTGTWTTT